MKTKFFQKTLFCVFSLLCCIGLQAQEEEAPFKIFDRFGNEYTQDDIKQERTNLKMMGTTELAFELDYQFDVTVFPEIEAALTDVTNYLCSIIEPTSNPCTQMPAVVRLAINAIDEAPTNGGALLGTASSYYYNFYQNDNGPSDVMYGNVWRAINTGIEPFAGFNNDENHGEINININPAVTQWWGEAADSNVFGDNPTLNLTQILLHEMTHALGIASLIRSSGESNQSGYSHYDMHLFYNHDDNNNTEELPFIDQSSCYNFMSNISISQPENAIVAACGANDSDITYSAAVTTECAVSFVGENVINNANGGALPIYSPTCWEQGSSLSHFDGSSCMSYQDYLMSPSISNTTGGEPIITLMPWELYVLCDLGYNIIDENEESFCNTEFSVAVDDYEGDCMTPFRVNQCEAFTLEYDTFLGNDINVSDNNVCFEVIWGNGTITDNGTDIVFEQGSIGLNVISYTPENNDGQSTNSAFIYIIVQPCFEDCNPDFTTDCDLICNGRFELNTECEGGIYESESLYGTISDCEDNQSNASSLSYDKIDCCIDGWDNISLTPDYGYSSAIIFSNNSVENDDIAVAQAIGLSQSESIQTFINPQMNQQYLFSFSEVVLMKSSNNPNTIFSNIVNDLFIYVVDANRVATIAGSWVLSGDVLVELEDDEFDLLYHGQNLDNYDWEQQIACWEYSGGISNPVLLFEMIDDDAPNEYMMFDNIQLVEDNFDDIFPEEGTTISLSDPDCLFGGDVTLGQEICGQIDNMTYCWENLTTGQDLGCGEHPQIVVNPTITTTYQLTREIVNNPTMPVNYDNSCIFRERTVTVQTDVCCQDTQITIDATVNNDCEFILDVDFPLSTGETITEWWWYTDAIDTDNIFLDNLTGSDYDDIVVTEEGSYILQIVTNQDCYIGQVVVNTTDDIVNTSLTFCDDQQDVVNLNSLLNDNLEGGVWEDNNFDGLFSPLDNGVGQYSFTFILEGSSDCLDQTQTFEIEVILAPDSGIGTTMDVCPDDNAFDLFTTLDGNPQIGGTWTYLGTSVSNIFDPSISPSGFYQYIVENQSCEVFTESFIMITDIGAINIQTLNQSTCGGSQTLTAQPNIYDSYDWFLDGNLLQSGANSNFLALQDGNYQVVGYNNCGLSTTSPVLTVALEESMPPNGSAWLVDPNGMIITAEETVIWDLTSGEDYYIGGDINVFGTLNLKIGENIAQGDYDAYSRIRFAPNVHINVHPDGKLALGHVRLMSFCDDNLWGGIQVIGDEQEPINCLYDENGVPVGSGDGEGPVGDFQIFHGQIEGQGTSIENAIVGVNFISTTTFNTGDFTSTNGGGACKLLGVRFLNNVNSMHMRRQPMPDGGLNCNFIKECRFINDNPLITNNNTLFDDGDVFQIILDGTHGLIIKRCSFEGWGAEGDINEPQANGVLATNSNFAIKSGTANTEFKDLFRGVISITSEGDNFGVVDAIFNNVFQGITANSTPGAIIKDNRFENIPLSIDANINSYGIFLTACDLFEVERNLFQTDVVANENQWNFGFVVEQVNALGGNVMAENSFRGGFRGATVFQGPFSSNLIINNIDFGCNYYLEENGEVPIADWCIDGEIHAINNICGNNQITGSPIRMTWHNTGQGGRHIEATGNYDFANSDLVFHDDFLPTEIVGGDGNPLDVCNEGVFDCTGQILESPVPAGGGGNWGQTFCPKYSETKNFIQTGEKMAARANLQCYNEVWSNFMVTADFIAEKDVTQAQSYLNLVPNTSETIDRKEIYQTLIYGIEGNGKMAANEDKIRSIASLPSDDPAQPLAESILAIYFGEETYRKVRLGNRQQDNSKVTTSLLKTYPNPAADQINIEIDNYLIQEGTFLRFRQVDGRIVTEQPIDKIAIGCDIKVLENGIYIAELWDDDGLQATTKIVVIK